MLFNTIRTFQQGLEYTKSSDGTWTAEFNGTLHVRVKDSSLERCRRGALDDLDTQVAAWLAPPTTAHRVLIESRRLNTPGKTKRANAKSR